MDRWKLREGVAKKAATPGEGTVDVEEEKKKKQQKKPDNSDKKGSDIGNDSPAEDAAIGAEDASSPLARSGQEATPSSSKDGSRKSPPKKREEDQLIAFAASCVLAHVLAPQGEIAACDASKDKESGSSWRVDLVEHVLDGFDMEASKRTMLAVVEDGISLDVYSMINVMLQNEKLHKDLLLTSLITQAISGGVYDARVRTCLRRFALELNISRTHFREVESTLAAALAKLRHEKADEIEEERVSQVNAAKRKRYMKIALGTIIGGTIIGVTGGLAAPLVAAGLGAVLGTSAAVSLGSVVGIYAIGSLFGVYGARFGAYRMKNRSGALEEFRFHPLQDAAAKSQDTNEQGDSSENKDRLDGEDAAEQQQEQEEHLSVTVCISGWVKTKEDKYKDFIEPWRSLNIETDLYCLSFDHKYLYALGVAIEKLLTDRAVGFVIKEVIKRTVFASLMAAIALPSIFLEIGKMVDNPWTVACNRAEHAGVELANALLSRVQGTRPVTLVGYSLGALSIYYCLKEMSKRKHSTGILENVFLFGAPLSADARAWKDLTPLVAGRFVIGHSMNDWLLAFLCRSRSFSRYVAGVHGVKCPGVESLDLGDIIKERSNYSSSMDRVLLRAGLRDVHYGFPHKGGNGSRVYVEGSGHGIQRYFGPWHAEDEQDLSCTSSTAADTGDKEQATTMQATMRDVQTSRAQESAEEGAEKALVQSSVNDDRNATDCSESQGEPSGDACLDSTDGATVDADVREPFFSAFDDEASLLRSSGSTSLLPPLIASSPEANVPTAAVSSESSSDTAALDSALAELHKKDEAELLRSLDKALTADEQAEHTAVKPPADRSGDVAATSSSPATLTGTGTATSKEKKRKGSTEKKQPKKKKSKKGPPLSSYCVGVCLDKPLQDATSLPKKAVANDDAHAYFRSSQGYGIVVGLASRNVRCAESHLTRGMCYSPVCQETAGLRCFAPSCIAARQETLHKIPYVKPTDVDAPEKQGFFSRFTSKFQSKPKTKKKDEEGSNGKSSATGTKKKVTSTTTESSKA